MEIEAVQPAFGGVEDGSQSAQQASGNKPNDNVEMWIKSLEDMIQKKKQIGDDGNGMNAIHYAAGCMFQAEEPSGGDKKLSSLEAKEFLQPQNTHSSAPISLQEQSQAAQIVKQLLVKEDVDVCDGNGATPLHHAARRGCVEVVKVLLDKGANCSLKDRSGSNPLDLAIDGGHEVVVKVILESEQWEESLRNTTTNSEKTETTPFRKLIRKMPDMARYVLYRCTTFEKCNDKQCSITYNYEFVDDFQDPDADKSSGFVGRLMRCVCVCNRTNKRNQNVWGPKEFKSLNHTLHLMMESDDIGLVGHPLVRSLLNYKLRRYVGPLYLLLTVLHILFVFFITLYAALLPRPNSDICQVVNSGASIVNSSNTLDTDSGLCGQSIHQRYGIIVIAVLILILDTMMIIEKVAELVGVILLWEFYFIKSYFTSILNWLEIPLSVCAIIFVSVVGRRCQCPTMWQWEIGVAAVLLVWFHLIFILRKFQIFNVGIYVLMFGRITRIFLHTFLLSVPLLITFAIVFNLAFFQPQEDSSPFAGSLVFFTALSDTADIGSISEANIVYPAALLGLFYIIYTLVLLNMLIALAVDDIQGIKERSELERLKLLVDLVLSTESGPMVYQRHLFVIPDKKITNGKFSFWKAISDLLWTGKLDHDTPEKVAEVLAAQSEPSIKRVNKAIETLSDQSDRVLQAVRKLSATN